MAGYLPHAVRGASGAMSVVVSDCEVIYTPSQAPGTRYTIYTTLEALGLSSYRPNMKKIRFIGILSVNIVSSGGGSSRTATASGGYYDSIIAASIASPYSLTVEEAVSLIRNTLIGNVCTVRNMGGRWVVS